MENKRILSIDILKALGIWLVILGHLPLVNRELTSVIFSFHMPLFFFCSGYLFHYKQDQKAYLKKNARQLLLVMVPYFILSMGFETVQDYVFYRSNLSLQNNVIAPVVNFLTGDSKIGWMWFLWALFWMRIVYNMLYAKLHTYSYARHALLAASLCIGFIVYLCDFRFNYYQITAFLLSMPFFCTGALLGQYKESTYSHGIARWVVLICCAVFYGIAYSHLGRVNMNALDCGSHYTLFLMAGLSAVVGLFLLFKNVHVANAVHSVIITLSNGTLVVLGFHGFLIQACKIGYKKLLHITIPPPYMDTVSGIAVSLFILVVLYFLAKYIVNHHSKYVRLLSGK